MLHGAVPFLVLPVSTHQMLQWPPVITKPKQHPHFQKPQQGHYGLLLGQLGQERQSLRGTCPRHRGWCWRGQTLRKAPSTRRTQGKHAPPLSTPARIKSQEGSLRPALAAWRWGGPPLPSAPAAHTLGLGPGGRVQAPALASAGSGAGSGSLTFPTRVRSRVKAPSYKESSSERRIPEP